MSLGRGDRDFPPFRGNPGILSVIGAHKQVRPYNSAFLMETWYQNRLQSLASPEPDNHLIAQFLASDFFQVPERGEFLL